MRASPALQVTFRHVGAWRGGVLVVVVAACMVVVAWAAAWPTAHRPLLVFAVGGVIVAIGLLGRSLVAVVPVSLRWDGQHWHLGPDTSIGDEPLQGTVSVNIDLGSWMLLRFVADAQSAAADRRSVTWLPVQRLGLESQWHVLRCAVHGSATTAAASDPTIDR